LKHTINTKSTSLGHKQK